MLGRVFKAYDIRGTYPDPLTDKMATQIGFGVSRYLLTTAQAAGKTEPMMKHIVVGRDMRTSSPKLTNHLITGITNHGGNVIDVGLVDTPFIYFAVNHLDCAGGVVTTASHNPPKYNGFKVSGPKARPIGETSGLAEIRKYAATIERGASSGHGHVEQRDLWDAYVNHVRSFLDIDAIKARPLKVVVDASNGMAGAMCPRVFGDRGGDIPGLEIVELNYDITSGEFVHEPNPLVAANLVQTQEAVKEHKADLGICFDGDADRCVVVDEKGRIVGCDHLTALLAGYFLEKRRGARIIYDLRSTKAVAEEILKAGGKPVRSRVGHVFMKALMAEHDASFGGELSGHFYFRNNFYADSGAIAMATVLTFLARADKPMSRLIKPIARYAQSGEINFEIEEKDEALAELIGAFGPASDVGASVDELDGVTIDAFKDRGWWCNVRKSNTEPLLRLNCEARDQATLDDALARISPLLGQRVEH
jgi:phosphomannomutase